MNKEEAELLFVLWENYTDEEIITLEQEVVDRGCSAFFAAMDWMRFSSIGDVSHRLSFLRKYAPETYLRCMAAGQQQFPAKQWTAIVGMLASASTNQ
jgi:hypothetical protein